MRTKSDGKNQRRNRGRPRGPRYLPRPSMPLKAEIARFIEIFDILELYEVNQRIARGDAAGVFTRENIPDDSVVKTRAWLKGLVA